MKIARTSLNFGIHCDRNKYYSIRDKRWYVISKLPLKELYRNFILEIYYMR